MWLFSNLAENDLFNTFAILHTHPEYTSHIHFSSYAVYQALNEQHRDKHVAVVSIVTKLTFCVMEESLMLLIRAAAVSDVPLLLRFSREFAEYERQPDALVITEETLIRDGFGARPKFRSLIAEWDGQAVGYALFFGIYSSLKGSG